MINEPFKYDSSPITAKTLTQDTVRLSEPSIDNDSIFWLESRPSEKGRNVLVRKQINADPEDVLKGDISIKTRAHEYGGASYITTDEYIFTVFNHDQRIYQTPLNNHENSQPIAITPEGNYRYADFFWDETNQHLIAVREDHSEKDATTNIQEKNEVISINIYNSNAITILLTGADFYSNPRISPDGKHLSWLSWNHPNMPWDSSQCYLAEIDNLGNTRNTQLVAGGNNESIFQPEWSPDGFLFFVSDRSNWWNLYRYNQTTKSSHCLHKMEAEFATPQWTFGMSTYSFLGDDKILCCYTKNGIWQLAQIDLTNNNSFMNITTALTDISSIKCHGNGAILLGANSTQAEALLSYNPNTKKNPLSIIALSQPDTPFPDYISSPQTITFKTTDNALAHGFYYAPKNPHLSFIDKILPPLIVLCHGGPTGATSSALNYKIQYWTTRGFAVFDINYRGSTGFGRKYRDSLKLNWGIADVIDIASGAQTLVDMKLADPEKLIVRGSSAGGYTVLAALTFTETFSVGASLYGIGDLETLANDTHKFESHYLDSLIGPYPQYKSRYQERSPIHHIEQLTCPVIFFQGLQDKVVLPNQAEAMVKALNKKGISNRYITFKEEAHGFRQADNIETVYQKELAFYQDILKL